MTETFKYAAFISYSSRDDDFALRFHRAIESYGIPVALGLFKLTSSGRRNRIYPVFRDRDELPSGNLSEQIKAALDASRTMIVICSPHSAASPWVKAEIEYFAGIGRGGQIYAVIADTVPLQDATGQDLARDCLPELLRGGEAEIVAADARPRRDGFRKALIKVVSGLIDVNAGQLMDRDKQRRRRAYTIGAVAAASLVAITIYTACGVGVVLRARDALATAQAAPSRLRRAALAVQALPPPSSAFPLGWPTANASRLLYEGGFDHLQALQSGAPHGVPTALAPDGHDMIAGFSDGAILRFDGKTSELVWQGDGRIVDIAISADGKALAVLMPDGHLAILNLGTGKAASSEVAGRATAIGISDDGGLMFLGMADGNLLIGNPAVGFDKLGSHAQPVTMVDVKGAKLVSGAADGSVYLWGIAASHPKYRVLIPAQRDTHGAAVSGLALSRNGRFVGVGTRDGHVSEIDISAARIMALGNQGTPVLDIGFSPDGTRMAAPLESGTTAVWTGSDNKPTLLTGHDAAAIDAKFTSDGRLVTVGYDETVRWWSVDRAFNTNEGLRNHACRLANSPFFTSPDTSRLIDGANKGQVSASVRQACARRGMLDFFDVSGG